MDGQDMPQALHLLPMEPPSSRQHSLESHLLELEDNFIWYHYDYSGPAERWCWLPRIWIQKLVTTALLVSKSPNSFYFKVRSRLSLRGQGSATI